MILPNIPPCFCKGSGRRMRLSPTGPNKRGINILADCCGKCGKMWTVYKDVTWHEYIWIMAFNRKSEAYRHDHILVPIPGGMLGIDV